jgi:hypothetical protein
MQNTARLLKLLNLSHLVAKRIRGFKDSSIYYVMILFINIQTQLILFLPNL